MELELFILAVGRDAAIMQVVERLINAHEGWHAAIASTTEQASNLFAESGTAFHIVFVCAGISEQEEEALRQQLLQKDPDVVVTRHYGGGSGLLENEVLTILHQKSLK
jgi:hypothetical protein